ncbi:MAG: phosphotransferase [Isosphaeraceae bacterium]
MINNVPRILLARYPSLIQPLSVLEPLGNAGGTSGSRLWRFDSARGPLVVRAWPIDGPSLARLRWIHQILFQVQDLRFIPVPERDRQGVSIQEHAGRLWDLSPWMPGSADPGRPPPTLRLRSAFAALARFHQRTRHVGRSLDVSPGLRARLTEMDALLGGGFNTLEDALNRAPADPLSDLARHWLGLAIRLTLPVADSIRRLADQRRTLIPCLRDVRPDHFLFEGNQVTGLVDFGALGVETVSADLARLLTEGVGPDRLARAEALNAYAKVRTLNDDEAALIAPFERSAALLRGARWIRWHFIDGKTFDDSDAVRRGLERAVEGVRGLTLESGLG